MKLISAVLLLSCVLCALAQTTLHDDFPFEYNEKPEDNDLLCKRAKCVGLGQSCTPTDGHIIGCRPGTYAALEGGHEHKFCVCKAIPFSIWRAPCNMTGLYECGLDLRCQADHEGVTRCLGKRNHGDACSTNMDCRNGNDCKDGICFSVLQIGSSCKTHSPGAPDACPPDTSCTPNWLGQYVCKAKSGLGETCKTSSCCKSGLGCYNGKCIDLFTLADYTPTSDALLCQSGFKSWGRGEGLCAPLPINWHDIEGAPCNGDCGDAGRCMCSSWLDRNNTGICTARAAYDHKAQDAIKAVFALTSGKCYPDLMTPGLYLTPIPAYDCAMRIAGPKLMATAFCWYLRNIYLLNGNGAAPNCNPGFNLWLASFCPKIE